MGGVDSAFADLRAALRRMREEMDLRAIDDDGELTMTAAMLALKRGCRR